MKKPLVAVAAGAGVFALVAAGAATLNINTGSFVPSAGNLSSTCATSADVETISAGEDVDYVQVTLNNGNTCNPNPGSPQYMRVILYDDDSADGIVGTVSADPVEPGSDVWLANFASSIPVESVDSIAVVISDGDDTGPTPSPSPSPSVD